MCGVVDWIENLIYFAEEFGMKLLLKEAKDLGSDEKLAIFELKRKKRA